jgi:hypothetical protein
MVKRHTIKVSRIPLVEKTYIKEANFSRMPQLYLELLENKSKIKKEFLNVEHIEYLSHNTSPNNDNFDSYSLESEECKTPDFSNSPPPPSTKQLPQFKNTFNNFNKLDDDDNYSDDDNNVIADDRKFGDRDDRKFGDRDGRKFVDRDERKFVDRDERKFVDRDERKFVDRDERKFVDRDERKFSSKNFVDSDSEIDDISIKSMSDKSFVSNEKLQKRLIDLLGDNKGGRIKKDERQPVPERYENTRGGNKKIDTRGSRREEIRGYDIPEKGTRGNDNMSGQFKRSADGGNPDKAQGGRDKNFRKDIPERDYDFNDNDDNDDYEASLPPPENKFKNPPTLKELESKNNLQRNIEDASDSDDKKRHLIHKFKSLQKSYPGEKIQEYTIYSDYDVMKEDYDETLKKLSMDSTVESYKKYLTYGFMGVEYLFGNFFGLDMKGFTQQQLISMKSYDKLLIELGEKNYEPVGSSKWPVEVRLIFLIIINSAFFIGSKIILSKSGTNFIDIMNNFSSFATSSEKAPKKKMKEPPLNLDDD